MTKQEHQKKEESFIYSFLAALGLRHCMRAFSGCGEPGLLFSCGLRAQYLWCMGLVALKQWDLPGPGIKPMSPALAGRF